MTAETTTAERPPANRAEQGELTPRQARFVAEYLLDLSATAAARRAGYSAKTAKEIGYGLLRKTAVAAAIARLQAYRLAKTGKKAQDVLDELIRIGFSDIRQVMSWSKDGVTLKASAELDADAAAAVSEVVETRTKKGGSMRVKLHDKIAALDKLGRHFQLFGKDEPAPVGARLVLQVEWPDGTPVPARIKKLGDHG